MVSLWRSAVTSTAGNNTGVFFRLIFRLLQKSRSYMSNGYFVLPRISMDIVAGDASVAGQSPQEP